jgi:phosphoglucomutase
MLRFTLADGGRVTVRGSGTEPKLKYYIALRTDVGGPEALDAAKAALDARLDAVWAALQADVAARLQGGA